MSKTETNHPTGENFASSENEISPRTYQSKIKSRRWVYTKPDLTKPCFICNSQIKIKYILPKKQYSLKNNWGYWTGKTVFNHKYACNSCLVNIHKGGIINWVSDSEKADIFYTYLSRKNFAE